LKAQVADRLAGCADGSLRAAAETLTTNLGVVESEIYQVRNQSGQDPLNFPIRINNRLAALLSVVNHGDGRPVGNAAEIFNDLVRELKTQTDGLQLVERTDVAAFNAEATRLGLAPVR
jgi:hypothetical protein